MLNGNGNGIRRDASESTSRRGAGAAPARMLGWIATGVVYSPDAWPQILQAHFRACYVDRAAAQAPPIAHQASIVHGLACMPAVVAPRTTFGLDRHVAATSRAG